MDALSLRGKIGESDRCEPPSRSARIRRKTEGRPRFGTCNGADPRTTGPVAFTKHALAKNEAQPNFSPAIAGICGGRYIFGKSCEEILSVDDWSAKVPPKQGSRRGRDYRNATELAKSWFGPPNAAPPDELLLILRRLFPAADVILTDPNPEASLPSIISVASKGIPTCRVGH